MKLFQLSIHAFASIVLALLPIGANAEGPNQEDLAASRLDELKKNAKSFRLDLSYFGDQNKPFYQLTLSVGMITPPEESFFQKYHQINEGEAQSIIDQLAVEIVALLAWTKSSSLGASFSNSMAVMDPMQGRMPAGPMFAIERALVFRAEIRSTTFSTNNHSLPSVRFIVKSKASLSGILN